MKRSRFSEEPIIGILKEHRLACLRRIYVASTGSAMRRFTNGGPNMVAWKYRSHRRIPPLSGGIHLNTLSGFPGPLQYCSGSNGTIVIAGMIAHRHEECTVSVQISRRSPVIASLFRCT